MKVTQQIAKHMRDVHFGGNWTSVNLKDTLDDVTWQQATKQIGTFHSIATLVFHMNYYIAATINVLRGGELNAKDSLSFDCPMISSQQDWAQLLEKTWADAEELASLIEAVPVERLQDHFVDPKYGSHFRCLQGPIEHCHYHLGQIALMKSMLLDSESPKSSEPVT